MKLKHGVNPKGVCREIWFYLGAADQIYRHNYSVELVITSLNDGVHSPNSLHKQGKAADLRTRYFTYKKVHQLHTHLRTLLDPLGFDTVLERDHIHVEWDPKEGEQFLTYTS